MGRPDSGLGSDPSGRGWRPAPLTTEPSEQQRGESPRSTVEPPAGRGTVVGEARGVQQRTEQYGQNQLRTVLTFRLERHDREGNRLSPIAVEMRGVSFEGVLHDGDWVSLSGTWRDGTLRARKLQNLTNGATLRTKSYRLLTTAVFVVGFALALTVILVAVRVLLSVDSDVRPVRDPRIVVRPSQ
jgi:hypothetical protein